MSGLPAINPEGDIHQQKRTSDDAILDLLDPLPVLGGNDEQTGSKKEMEEVDGIQSTEAPVRHLGVSLSLVLVTYLYRVSSVPCPSIDCAQDR